MFSRSDNLKRHRLHVHGISLTSVDTNNDIPSNKKTVENETQAGVQPQQFSRPIKFHIFNMLIIPITVTVVYFFEHTQRVCKKPELRNLP